MTGRTVLGALAVFAMTAATLAVAQPADTQGQSERRAEMRSGGHGGPHAGHHGRHHGRGGPAMFDFDALDADRDGRITRDEIEGARAARIAALDADGDGFVSRDELVAFRTEQARQRIERGVDRMFERMDADGDGRLSAAELMVRPDRMQGRMLDRMFDRVDTDGDGAISRAEYDAAKARMAERRGEGRKGQRGERARPAPQND